MIIISIPELQHLWSVWEILKEIIEHPHCFSKANVLCYNEATEVGHIQCMNNLICIQVSDLLAIYRTSKIKTYRIKRNINDMHMIENICQFETV